MNIELTTPDLCLLDSKSLNFILQHSHLLDECFTFVHMKCQTNETKIILKNVTSKK